MLVTKGRVEKMLVNMGRGLRTPPLTNFASDCFEISLCIDDTLLELLGMAGIMAR